jgi:hypothetical protein
VFGDDDGLVNDTERDGYDNENDVEDMSQYGKS